MGIIRMFSATCDSCNEDYADGAAEWWSAALKEQLKADGWSVGRRIICPDCKES